MRLRSNVPGSMRDIAVAITAPGHWLSWGRLAEAVRSGKRQTQATLGRELFQYYAENPDEGSAFTAAMSNGSTMIAEDLARVLDTATAEHVVDIGGAAGAIIAALLESNPALHGTILELADVVPRARAALAERGLSSRCQVVEGDFFTAVPPADIHILKQIIHDWDDEQSVRILSNCANSLRRNGRVILIEYVLPEDGRFSYAPLMDLDMLVLLPDASEPLSNTASYSTRPVFASTASLRQLRRCTLSRALSRRPKPREHPVRPKVGDRPTR
jgi:SAM-dependent methyltransferase